MPPRAAAGNHREAPPRLPNCLLRSRRRPHVVRDPTEERIGTGAKTVAVSCPFCLTMMTDGIAAKDDQVKVRDIAELMAEENLNQP